MNIDFISVGVKNFRSYGNLLTKYEFNNGLDLVVGTNGNGKTSLILHGIVYALYGVGINGENIDTLINDVNKKNMLVELELLSNGIHYKIIRGRKPNILEIYVDGSEEPKPTISMKEDDAYILENILGGIDKNIFLKLFAIQSNNQETSIFRMSTDARRKLFESLFDLTIYSQMKVENDKNISNFKMDIIDFNKSLDADTNSVKMINENILSIENFIKSNENRIIEDNKIKDNKIKEIKVFEEETLKELKILEKEANELEVKLSKINLKDLENKRKALDTRNQEIINIKSKINASNELLSKNILEFKSKNEELKKLEKDLLTNEYIDKITKEKTLYTEKINNAKREISEISTKFKMEEKFLLDIGECANGNTEFLNCVKKKFGNDKYDKQEWEEKVKPQFEKDIATREVEIKKYETEISKNAILVNNINNIKSSINKINEEMKEALLKLNELNFSEKLTSNNFLKLWEEKVITFDKEIEENNININKFNEEISSFKVIENALVNVRYNIKQKNKLNSDSLKIDLENIEKSIIKSNEDIIKQKEEIVQKNKMLVDLNSKITTNTKLLQEIQEKLNAKIELGEFLKQEKIKYHIMQKSFPILREEFNKILKRMFYGEIRVFIDNKFDITVVRNGLEKNFENFSEGEKKRLDLGFIFTIHEFLSQKNQINTNILIMDELLDSALDSEGTEAVVDYLSEIKLTRNIILITHRNENIEYDRKFVLKKEARFSVIKEVD